MSTFLLVIVHLLADMGVPMMRQVEQHYSPTVTHVQRSGPEGAHDGASQSRSASYDWDKRASKFDDTQEISNGF
jgi:hypothetical protein